MTALPQLPFPGRRRARTQAPERKTHIAIADLLRRASNPNWLFLHVPNGEYRTPETAALLQRMGVLAGAADFLLFGPTGQPYWLELKRGVAPLSLAQIRFRTEMRTRGVPYVVARTFEEAVAALAGWGVLRKLEVQ